jgi:hypothetical protein
MSSRKRKREPREAIAKRMRALRARRLQKKLQSRDTIFRNCLGIFYKQRSLRRTDWVLLSEFLDSPTAAACGGREHESAYVSISNIEFGVIRSESGSVKIVRPLWL